MSGRIGFVIPPAYGGSSRCSDSSARGAPERGTASILDCGFGCEPVPFDGSRRCAVGSFFEVSRAATRRARIRSELPTASPAAVDQIAAGIAGLPDPEFLCAEERAGALAGVARMRNQLDAYLIAVAGAADRHGDSRVLHAGTTGTLVAAATGGTSAAGSAMVATARELAGLPQVAAAFAAGDLSVSHVHAITTTASAIDDFTGHRSGRGRGRRDDRRRRNPAHPAGHRRCPPPRTLRPGPGQATGQAQPATVGPSVGHVAADGPSGRDRGGTVRRTPGRLHAAPRPPGFHDP